jgi:hypothetical protein
LIALQQSSIIFYLSLVIARLISIAIYVPLFIVIYLIANPDSPLAIPPAPQDTLPEEDTPPDDETT